jgi:hypothetical protein
MLLLLIRYSLSFIIKSSWYSNRLFEVLHLCYDCDIAVECARVSFHHGHKQCLYHLILIDASFPFPNGTYLFFKGYHHRDVQIAQSSIYVCHDRKLSLFGTRFIGSCIDTMTNGFFNEHAGHSWELYQIDIFHFGAKIKMTDLDQANDFFCKSEGPSHNTTINSSQVQTVTLLILHSTFLPCDSRTSCPC